jgi:hypothetical protein
MKKKINLISNKKNIEVVSLINYIEDLKLNAEIVKHDRLRGVYTYAMEHPEEEYIMGKCFGHGTFTDECSKFTALLKEGYSDRLWFIEKPPFRFKQGVNDKLNDKICGVMLNKLCSFTNEYSVDKFMQTNYNHNEIKVRTAKFKKYWLTNNEIDDEFEYKKEYLIYFPLQLPQDASISLTGHQYPLNEMIRTLYGILKRLRKDFVIVIREHPYHKRNYKYDLGTIDARIIITDDIPHHTLLTNSNIVVSYNSSSLAEAILNHKKVLYFSNLPAVNVPGIGYRFTSWNYYDAAFLNYSAYMIKYYLNQPVNQYLYDKYVYFITNELSFFPGFHSDDEIKTWIGDKLKIN